MAIIRQTTYNERLIDWTCHVLSHIPGITPIRTPCLSNLRSKQFKLWPRLLRTSITQQPINKKKHSYTSTYIQEQLPTMRT